MSAALRELGEQSIWWVEGRWGRSGWVSTDLMTLNQAQAYVREQTDWANETFGEDTSEFHIQTNVEGAAELLAENPGW